MEKSFVIERAFTPTEVEDFMNMLESLRQKVDTFSVNLSKDERRAARNVALKRVGYVRDVLTASVLFEKYLPRDIDLDKFKRTMMFFDDLKEMKTLTEAMAEHLDDTAVAAGKMLMVYSDICYEALKSARKREANLDRTIEELKKFYKKGSALNGDGSNSEPSTEEDSG